MRGAAAGRAAYFGFDHLSLAGASLATTLWLQGYSEQASARALKAVNDAERMNHPISLVIALTAITVLLWTDELDGNRTVVRRFSLWIRPEDIESSASLKVDRAAG